MYWLKEALTLTRCVVEGGAKGSGAAVVTSAYGESWMASCLSPVLPFCRSLCMT